MEVWFDQGIITLSDRAHPVGGEFLAALGLTAGDLEGGDLRVASPGTPRLLVRVRKRRTLLSMRPDFAQLAAECRRAGLLGCFAYAMRARIGGNVH